MPDLIDRSRINEKRLTHGLDTVVTKHPLGVLPKGNALMILGGDDRKLKLKTLGPYFGQLPDEVIIGILQEIDDPLDLLHVGYTCKGLYAYSWFDELWKSMMYYQKKIPNFWSGTWRRTFLEIANDDKDTLDSSLIIDCTGVVYSDFLYRPFQCSQIDYYKYIGSEKEVIRRQNIHIFDNESEITLNKFDGDESWHNKPFIVTLDKPIAKWSLDELLSKFGNTIFYQEYMSWKLSVYAQYMADNQDESPLYLFDCKSTALQNLNYQVPLDNLFGKDRDFFELFGPELRPDHRWLIIGCGRSGSSFHKDPNGTSAWNSIISGGAKYWIMFPPDSPPPGVSTDGELESEVTAPISVAEWFLGGFYNQAKMRSDFYEGICYPGQVMYVPAGWWHLVVNLDASIAMTGNFVPLPKLPFVLDFLKNKFEQISGFKDDNTPCEDIFRIFQQLIKRHSPSGILETALDDMVKIENARQNKRKWQTIVESSEAQGFSFGFDEEEE